MPVFTGLEAAPLRILSEHQQPPVARRNQLKVIWNVTHEVNRPFSGTGSSVASILHKDSFPSTKSTFIQTLIWVIVKVKA